jgi:predicted RNase H-like HicB family nuclease
MAKSSKYELTAVIEKVEEGYVGYIAEINGVNTQGDTVEEVKENLLDALQLTFEARRELSKKQSAKKKGKIIYEELKIA